MSSDGSRDYLGDGLLANEAAAASREQPLPSVIADDAPALLAAPSAGERGAGVSDAVLFLLTVNVVIGSGIVGLPYAFNSAGLVVSLVSMVGWTAVYVVTLSWLLAALGRVGGELDWIGLVREFLGRKGELGATATVLLFTYGLLWSYAAMFSATASLLTTAALGWERECDIYNEPSDACVRANQLAALAFGAAMLPLSMVDIEGSGSLQAVFTAYRFVAVAAILTTVGVAALVGADAGGAAVPVAAAARRALSASAVAAAARRGARLGGGVDGAHWYDGLGIAFSTISTSQICHLQAPSLVRAAREPDRALRTLALALATTGALNAAVGVTGAFFGERTEQLATLNWKAYDGHGFDAPAGAPCAAWAVGVRMLVLAFPLLASASSFPISAVVLATNLNEVAPARVRARLSPAGLKVAGRLIAVLPPVLLTMAEHQLSVVFDVTGLCRCVVRGRAALRARAPPRRARAPCACYIVAFYNAPARAAALCSVWLCRPCCSSARTAAAGL